MTFIYSFLQKRKMHESQHGIAMVIVAYVLSVLMLVLGSDVFYNINSAAAGINVETEEETKKVTKESASELQSKEATSLLLQSNLVNPYHLGNTPQYGSDEVSAQGSLVAGDTVWLLGNAMDSFEYDNLMLRMGTIVSDESSKLTEKAESEKKTKEKSVKSLSVEVAASSTVITISKEEVAMLERIVQAEAGGEDMVGKILIANVIFNRIVDDEFPDSVESVIFDKSQGDYQFSPVGSGRYWSVKISDETKEAIQRALDGEDYSEGALYFIARKHTASTNAKWFDNNLNWLFKHGGHEFYR